ncbi:MAG: LPS assembly protein LptD, partial [Pseudomonadales bacterium]
LRIRDLPIAYFPWLRFPLNDDRQSGFLMPSGGHDSTNGTEIIVPYYFNLAPQYDATYQLNSLWKRGLVHDGQLRFLAGQSTNTINLGYINADDLYGGETVKDQTTGESFTLPPAEKQDRWYINARHHGNWSNRITSTINFSAVSDGQYLQDIGGDFGSRSLDRFANSVDQSLTSRRAPALERRGELKYRGDAWNTTLSVLGFQNLEPDQPKEYELLPRLTSDLSRRYGPATLRVGLELTSFDKNTELLAGPNAIVGERGVVDVTATLRRAALWGYIEPAIGVIHRNYDLDNTPANARRHAEITTPRLSLDTGLIFDRFFSVADTQMQQTLEPRLFFLYVEEDSQDDLPRFDVTPLTPGFDQLFRTNRFSGYDRIGDTQQLSLAVTSRLLRRNTGDELLSASLGQIYYFKDREVIYRPRPSDDPQA